MIPIYIALFNHPGKIMTRRFTSTHRTKYDLLVAEGSAVFVLTPSGIYNWRDWLRPAYNSLKEFYEDFPAKEFNIIIC